MELHLLLSRYRPNHSSVPSFVVHTQDVHRGYGFEQKLYSFKYQLLYLHFPTQSPFTEE